jgi:hypothetical protein
MLCLQSVILLYPRVSAKSMRHPNHTPGCREWLRDARPIPYRRADAGGGRRCFFQDDRFDRFHGLHQASAIRGREPLRKGAACFSIPINRVQVRLKWRKAEMSSAGTFIIVNQND